MQFLLKDEKVFFFVLIVLPLVLLSVAGNGDKSFNYTNLYQSQVEGFDDMRQKLLNYMQKLPAVSSFETTVIRKNMELKA